jgi:pilus assembly protein CpaB
MMGPIDDPEGPMRNKILMMLALAVGGGTASLWVAQTWLDGQASARLAELEAQSPDVRFQTLVVAAEPLRYGATLSSQNLKAIPWPSDDLPPGAYADVEALLKDGPRRVLAPLEVSEPILPAKITGPGEGAGLSRLIAEGRRAVSVRVDDVAGVAGFLMPGDRVDVVLTRDADGTNKGDVILENVKVLTVDQSADERAEGPQVARAVTIEVDPAGAQKIALARAVGSLSLTLRPAGDDAPAAVPGITSADLASGAPARRAVAAAPAAAAPVAEEGTTIWISRALQRTSYQVPGYGRPGPAVRIVTGPGADAASEEPAASEAPAAPETAAAETAADEGSSVQ